MLDEEYFIYGDETDLQYRLAKDGWNVYHVPEATTIHFGGRSLDRWRRRRMVYRGKMLFFKKHYGALHHYALRAMLGSVTAAKVGTWLLVWPLPSLKARARRELRSNIEVLRLCVNLE
jgi:GT2 family glycosyltransferase